MSSKIPLSKLKTNKLYKLRDVYISPEEQKNGLGVLKAHVNANKAKINFNTDLTICKKCKKNSVFVNYPLGVLVCKNCSTEQDTILDTNPEQYDHGDIIERCGFQINPLLPKSSMGGLTITGKPGYLFNIIKDVNRQIRPYNEVALWKTFRYIDDLCYDQIPPFILEEAKHLYSIVTKNIIKRGLPRIGIIAACVFIACKIKGFPRPKSEIAKLFYIRDRYIFKGYQIVTNILYSKNYDLNYQLTQLEYPTSLFIFCSKLKLNYAIANKIQDILTNVENTEITNELLAGSILFVSNIYKLRITKKAISKACNVPLTLITHNYNMLLSKASEILKLN